MYEIKNQQLQQAKLLCFIIDNNDHDHHLASSTFLLLLDTLRPGTDLNTSQ